MLEIFAVWSNVYSNCAKSTQINLYRHVRKVLLSNLVYIPYLKSKKERKADENRNEKAIETKWKREKTTETDEICMEWISDAIKTKFDVDIKSVTFPESLLEIQQ